MALGCGSDGEKGAEGRGRLLDVQRSAQGMTGITHRLYLDSFDDTYATTFSANVVAVDGDDVVLDKTRFYPTGGGQPCDLGEIEGPTGTLQVSDVRGRDAVMHKLPADHGLDIGQSVSGTIDWERRHAHMRMHTAQHLLSGLAYELFEGARTVGNQIGAHKSRLDLRPATLTEDEIAQLRAAFDAAVDDDIPLTMDVTDRQTLIDEVGAERSNVDMIPSSVQAMRIIRIGKQIDVCPCAGTHVRSLGELGPLGEVHVKSKGKGTKRFAYTLDGNPL